MNKKKMKMTGESSSAQEGNKKVCYCGVSYSYYIINYFRVNNFNYFLSG